MSAIINNISSNFKTRLLSALFIGFTIILGIFGPIWLFNSLMIAVAIGMLGEWYNITSKKFTHCLIGLLSISLAISSLILLKIIAPNYRLLLWYFLTIWSVDTFAMIGGKAIGGARLAPFISPSKTWSGLISGVLVAMLITAFLDLFLNFSENMMGSLKDINLSLITLFVASIAQLSDLFESFFKRIYGIKDSSNIIPGHGGILDRFDSVLLTAPLVYFLAIWHL